MLFRSEVSKKMRMRKVVRKKEVRIISPERKDKIVKTRNKSKKSNFMTMRLSLRWNCCYAGHVEGWFVGLGIGVGQRLGGGGGG